MIDSTPTDNVADADRERFDEALAELDILAGTASGGVEAVTARSDPQLALYGDFTSPLCYLASQRVDALNQRGSKISWRAVERHPELPVNGRRLDATTSAAAEAALAEARTRMRPSETLPSHPPRTAPNTQAAVSAYAEACGAEVPDQIRRLLFAAYWSTGVNIGRPEVLRTLLAATFMRETLSATPSANSATPSASPASPSRARPGDVSATGRGTVATMTETGCRS